MPKIKATLSAKSLDKAIAEIEAYRRKVEKFPEKAVEKAVEMGVEQAKDLAMYMLAYDSGQLVDGIIGETDGDKGRIVSTAFHTMFVEFGTGVRGKEEPHPEYFAMGWKYDVNEHGEAGWFYKGDDGKVHWTKGMPSRPFMHDTAQMMKEAIPWIAETVLEEGE